MVSVFYLLLIVLISTSLGRRVSRVANIKFSTFLEEFCFSIGLGLAILSFLTFILGIFGLLYKWIFRLLLIGAVIIFAKEIIRICFLFKNNLKNFLFVKRYKYQLISLIIIGLFVLPSFIIALLPPTDCDALVYHLTIPKIYIEQHQIHYIPYIAYSTLPLNIEMLCMFGMLIQSDILSKLILFLFSVLTVISLYSFGRKFFSKEIGLYAAVIFCTVPYVAIKSSYANVELSLAFYVVLCFYSFMNWLKFNDKKMFLIASLAAGFCIGIKYTGGVVACLLFIGAIYKLYFLNKERVGNTLRQIALAMIVIFVIGSPWYLKTYIDTGSLISPWVVSVFKYVQSTDPLPLSLRQIFINFLSYLWRINIYSLFWYLSFGPLYLLLIPPLLLLRKLDKTIRIILWYGLISLILFFLMRSPLRENRYFIPYLAMLSIACAYSYKRLISHDQFLKKILTIFILLTISFNLLLHIGKTAIKMPVVLGIQSREAYLRQRIPTYGVIMYVNESLDDSSKILLMGEQGYYFKKPFVVGQSYHTYIDYYTFDNIKDFLERLKELEITHIVLDKNYFYLEELRKKIWELLGQWEGRYFKVIYSEKGAALYRVCYD